MFDRRLLVTFAAATTLVGSFLPWLRSGSRSRSSYELLAIVDRLGFSPDGVVGSMIRLWPIVPLLLVLSSIGPWLPVRRSRIRRAGVAIAITAGAYAAGTSMVVLSAPSAEFLSIRLGPWVTLAGAVALVFSATLTLPGSAEATAGSAP